MISKVNELKTYEQWESFLRTQSDKNILKTSTKSILKQIIEMDKQNLMNVVKNVKEKVNDEEQLIKFINRDEIFNLTMKVTNNFNCKSYGEKLQILSLTNNKNLIEATFENNFANPIISELFADQFSPNRKLSQSTSSNKKRRQ